MRPFGTLGLRQPLERSEGGQEGQTFGMRHPRAAPVTKAAAKTGEVGRRGTAAGVERMRAAGVQTKRAAGCEECASSRGGPRPNAKPAAKHGDRRVIQVTRGSPGGAGSEA
ncbi:unnamed protein product [Prorocentrum cordatum]|uniref:PASTA domain-containing protein n=1 Tax=Prorocentrum cordatum TaxID=2364126 RepID=A0ABN9QN97_9DINO|nr:unnamed protein product [Polarella glacialis]